MYTLEIRPISEIVGLTAANMFKAAQYRTPPDLVGKPDLEQKFKDYMAATGQGWARWKGTLSPEEREQLSVPAAQAPAAQAAQNPAQAIQALMQSARQFGSQFNQEIRAYNQHIKQVHQSIAMLQKIDWNTSAVDPGTVIQQASALQQTLDSATAEQAKNMAFLQQLATQAAQLAQSAGGAGQSTEQAFNPTATPAPAAPASAGQGIAEQIGQGVGTALKAPGRALNQMRNQVGKGVDWARQQGSQFGRGYSGAESNQVILTAHMGSAAHLLK